MAALVKVFLVVMDCGDYYCECEHVVAVATTRELADERFSEAKAATRTPYRGRPYPAWTAGEIREVETDVYYGRSE